MGVSSIPALLAARGTPRWRQTLELQREALREELAAAQGRLTLIDRMISEGDSPMTSHDNRPTNLSITIARQRVEAMTAVILRGTVPTYSDEGLLWARATPLLEAAGIRPAGPCGVIELLHAYVERDVDLALLIPVVPGTTVPAPLEVVDLPARDCLVATVTGPYDLITEANRELGRHVAAEGLQMAPEATDGLADKGFNLYDVDPHEPGAPADIVPVTRVCWPLSDGAA